ncbi:MAG: hypothetical protein D8M58_08385 [Calditrichaeota bacterium]|nr:MAG: hypothetical protein DWQ03_18105 [Calditrichota bacterium]MBL1205399.1 hypothetical protein [Calditrichota bacterium]NOG45228.1 tRNA (5-methylaminomethyl-2-thiouridine)(34)-methyltransferase MnmD [Calditrichota bacterium]
MKILKTADGLDTLYSEKYKQTFHSEHGVLQEANHVFLQGAGVAERLQKKLKTSVLEIGFGTGFNFFLTAQKAAETETRLEFTSIENDLLKYDLFQKLNHSKTASENNLYSPFLEWRDGQPKILPEGKYKIDFGKNIFLKLLIGDAIKVSLPEQEFNAVYLDAFSPDKNLELWTVSFFSKLLLAMKRNGKLSTYSAKGSVRRAMIEAGFEVTKMKGPLGKREILTARKIL